MTRNSVKETLMTLPVQESIVYGPIHSRRLGHSLGINLLPSSYKLCSFNCVYCQYGYTSKPTLDPSNQVTDLPRPEEVSEALNGWLQAMSRRGNKVDSITFAGNGEPTLHPKFAEIVDRTRLFRNRYLPQAKLTILSNSSTVRSGDVREALELLDLRVMELDAGSEELMRQINRPAPRVCFGGTVAGLKKLKNVILQSLFIQGRITNADPNSVEQWVEKVKEIQPVLVQVYSLDRTPADMRLSKVNRPTLEWIASQVHWRAGVKAEIY